MPKIRKSVLLAAVVIGLVIVAGQYVYMFYFPWTNGYRVYTSERDGYKFAQANKLSSADKCPSDHDVPGFNIGCRAYFE